MKVLSDRSRLDITAISELHSCSGKRVLFVVPGSAIGDNVGYFLFIQSVIESLGPGGVAILNCGAASDIYRLDPRIEVFPLWISDAEMSNFELVIDFLEVPQIRKITEQPCDPEVVLTECVGLPPSTSYATKSGVSGTPSRISIFPLASSPMRSLPLQLCRHLVSEARSRKVGVTVHLNGMQRQSSAYVQALTPMEGDLVRIDLGSPSLGDLLDAIAGINYGIFCDSGPAHLSKLYAVRGIAIHTSADAQPLRGRFTNLDIWQSAYLGKFCAAPCGLAGPWIDARKRIGCMGSLQVPQAELAERAILIDDFTNQAMIANPIPCVEYLNKTKEQIWRAIEESWPK